MVVLRQVCAKVLRLFHQAATALMLILVCVETTAGGLHGRNQRRDAFSSVDRF
jgi:hypothetical protein